MEWQGTFFFRAKLWRQGLFWAKFWRQRLWSHVPARAGSSGQVGSVRHLGQVGQVESGNLGVLVVLLLLMPQKVILLFEFLATVTDTVQTVWAGFRMLAYLTKRKFLLTIFAV